MMNPHAALPALTIAERLRARSMGELDHIAAREIERLTDALRTLNTRDEAELDAMIDECKATIPGFAECIDSARANLGMADAEDLYAHAANVLTPIMLAPKS